jgi:uncharacterized membrane protein
MSEVQILQCPGCKEFIASDSKSCRFCHRPLDPQTIKTAVAATQEENKRYRRRHYLNHMLIGLALSAGGSLLTGLSVWDAFNSERGGHYVITWGLILAGVGDFLYGMFGILGEVLSKK